MDETRRCTAHSSQTGGRCRKAAIKGGTVCGSHGGRAPQVKLSARQRLLEAADPAAARLVRALESADERAAIAAAKLILDRAGLHPTQAVELSGRDGGPIQTQEVSWIEHCTLEEKQTILEIAERATQRMGT